MRSAILALPLLAACTGEANHLGNPLLWPVQAVTGGLTNAAYQQQRGQVELWVKTNHPALIDHIGAGGGPLLTRAFDLARVPAADRPTRVLQMQGDLGLYAANPEALIVALMAFGG